MEIVKRKTESYLFENLEGESKVFPFYELSIEEWVVYENRAPKYLIDFNRRHKPLVQDFRKKLEQGKELEAVVGELGRFLGRQWTTKCKITGRKFRAPVKQR